MVDSPETPDGGPTAWLGLVAAIGASLIIGFAGGWILRGDGSAATAATAATTEKTTAAVAERPLIARDVLGVVVLNGVGIAGAAGAVAEKARELGYADITTGDTAGVSGPTVVYHRDAPGVARRLADDLEVSTIRPLPGDLAAAAGDAYVVVVLGPG